MDLWNFVDIYFDTGVHDDFLYTHFLLLLLFSLNGSFVSVHTNRVQNKVAKHFIHAHFARLWTIDEETNFFSHAIDYK